MTRALEDVTVLELTTEFWSSLAGAMLGDFGACVIRVDDLSRGDGRFPDRDGRHPPAARDYQRELAHRNKRSLGLDLEQPEGRELVGELAGAVDVFLTDWPASRLAANGWDHEGLSARREDLITVRGSGFGPRGPDRDLPALDELAAARTGMMPILPQPGEPPVYAGAGQMYTSALLAFGTLLALHHRAETGEGQQVDSSLFAGNLYGASLDLQAFLAMDGERFLQPVSRLDAGNPMSGTLYPSADGRWVTLTMPDTDRWWPDFAQAVGLEVDDPRFDTHEKRCGESRLEMMQVLEDAFRRRSGAYWRSAFDEKRLSADVIESYEYPASDPQARSNRYVLELDDPGAGTIQTLGFPVHLGEGTARLGRRAPCTGQHSAEILEELLGVPAERLTELEARGVIA